MPWATARGVSDPSQLLLSREAETQRGRPNDVFTMAQHGSTIELLLVPRRNIVLILIVTIGLSQTTANTNAELRSAIIAGRRGGSMTMTPVKTNARTALARVATRRTAPTAASLVQSEPDTDPVTAIASLPAHFTSTTETSSATSPAATTAIRLTIRKTRRCVATIVSQVANSQVTTLTSPMNYSHLYPSVSSTPRISCTQIERNTCAHSSRRILNRSGQGQDRQPRLSRPSHPGSLL